MRTLIVGTCLAAMCSLAFAAKNPSVTKAYADGKGIVHIVTANGRDLTLPPEKGQEGVDKIQVTPDGKTVGWLVNRWDSCCVSYAIPTELVIWRSGHVIRRIHPSMAIWSWAFLKNGSELAYRISPLRGGWSGECVLAETATGKNLAVWDFPVDQNGNDSGDNSDEPEWAKQIP